MPRWTLAGLIAVVMLITALWSQSYLGRVHDREDSVRGCLRSTLDRHVNARGWRIAQAARFNSYLMGGPDAANNFAASVKYDVIATSLESRTRTTAKGRRAYCERAYPPTSILPWRA